MRELISFESHIDLLPLELKCKLSYHRIGLQAVINTITIQRQYTRPKIKQFERCPCLCEIQKVDSLKHKGSPFNCKLQHRVKRLRYYWPVLIKKFNFLSELVDEKFSFLNMNQLTNYLYLTRSDNMLKIKKKIFFIFLFLFIFQYAILRG